MFDIATLSDQSRLRESDNLECNLSDGLSACFLRSPQSGRSWLNPVPVIRKFRTSAIDGSYRGHLGNYREILGSSAVRRDFRHTVENSLWLFQGAFP
jgi:hypothetical protein